MATGNSLIDAGGAAELKQLRRDITATGFALGDPLFSVSIVRTDPTTAEETTADAVDVILSWDRRSGDQRAYSGDAGGSAPVTGRLKKFSPWDVKRGDRFALPDGTSGEVTRVPPERGGAIRAYFTVDVGL